MSWLLDEGDAGRTTSRRTLAACIHLLAYTNCAVNPLIYCLLNDRFRVTLRKLAQSSWRRRQGGVQRGRGLTAMVAGQPPRPGLILGRQAPVPVDVLRRTRPPTANEAATGDVNEANTTGVRQSANCSPPQKY